MRVCAWALSAMIGCITTAHSALLINHTEITFDYLLQQDCQKLIENGTVAASVTQEPTRMNFGNIDGDTTGIWCLTLTDSAAQQARIINLGALHPKCQISITADDITTSKACKSPDKES